MVPEVGRKNSVSDCGGTYFSAAMLAKLCSCRVREYDERVTLQVAGFRSTRNLLYCRIVSDNDNNNIII